MTRKSAPPRRVLIVGSSRMDSVGDSYRRALEGHYDVRVANPYELVNLTPPTWTRLPSTTFRQLSLTAASVLFREPSAFAFPKLLRIADEFAPDLVLVTTMEALPPHILKSMRRSNPSMKIFGVFSDALSNFGRGYFFDADYDALFFKDHYIVDKFRTKLGWRHVFYLPQACDPSLHRPLELTDEDRARYACDVTIAGNLHYFRVVQMSALLGRDIKIYGAYPPRWMKDQPLFRHHTRSEVTGDAKCRAMLGARIVLNNNHYAEINGTNKRTFEVAAIGAFQLTDTPALADVFVPDVEVATFDTLGDMVERVDHYLKHPEQRDAMAERARERAHREHTYAHRWAAHMVAMNLATPDSFPIREPSLAVRAS